ncbi:FemAB family protein [Scytonema sp. NUACC26]|uniref:FemAB family protein n=1 Tax=Scytonema sp. NUACC26 TaxID=3140176 RepID=UPI0034DC990E
MKSQIINLSSNLWTDILKTLPHDIYHELEYIYVDAIRTNTIPEAILVTQDDKIFFLPYLLRYCQPEEKEIFDVVSPYGYPGILLNEAALNSPQFLNKVIEELKNVFFYKNVCSAFFRLHPILNQDLDKLLPVSICKVNGETISINLELSEVEIWQQTRHSDRTRISKCKRAGMVAKMVPFMEYIDDFIEIYEETMHRVEAQYSYYFDYSYYLNLAILGKKIHLCIVEWEGEVTCAGLFTECCGIVQFHLSGTRNRFLKQAPSKLMLDYVRFWAKERGNKVFHLGGGVGSSHDRLYEFKSGFSKQRHNFLTMRLIVNEKKYLDLVNFQARVLETEPEKLLVNGFFPAYRCTGIK